jgi:TM2 domain-containing membrane protein YozV
MNCVNHPETPAVNYCQNCGKALCPECTRSISGMVFCEPCLAARLGVPPQAGAGAAAVPAYPAVGRAPSPVLAAILGLIPGVGAMYNGQFLKGIVHVIVFIALVSVTDHFGLFGLLVAAWVFYQVFDAYQTAHAMQFGLPLPDPLGLNNVGAKLGIAQPVTYVPTAVPGAGTVPPTAVPPSAVYPGSAPPVAGFAAPYAPYAQPGAYPQPGQPVPPIPPYAPDGTPVDPALNPYAEPQPRSLPVGAIVLIALGAIFLLGTVGVLNEHWLAHGWPLIIIAVGAWLLYKNSRNFQGGPK